MTPCSEIRELFAAVLEHEAGDDEAARVRAHVAGCAECAQLLGAMASVVGPEALLEGLEPPARLAEEIAASPCRRWLGLLHQAVDREITETNLERLLTHLESCATCRRAWHDLTLIHQVSDAMVPPKHLLARCIRARDAIARIAILPRRTATAAAYLLALAASLAIGNPAIIAQDLQETATEQVSRAASEVGEVAAHGRGEVRVALWRAMRWGESRIDVVRGWIDELRNDDAATGGDAAGSDQKPQGDIP
ncbi:MAG: zf-HC2 domain-containing protein [Thermoanaerobaculales bacterium]|jgi:predicted anti-sigma-YlaC factor YlaD|nr:zf-HC2 domain-containing protein [Thermoanaerobaculales bacterium]